MPIVAWFSFSVVIDTIGIMTSFAGLIVITEIDNWAAEIFELYIETFHEELLKREDYLEFISDNEARATSYYQVIFTALAMLL